MSRLAESPARFHSSALNPSTSREPTRDLTPRVFEVLPRAELPGVFSSFSLSMTNCRPARRTDQREGRLTIHWRAPVSVWRLARWLVRTARLTAFDRIPQASGGTVNLGSTLTGKGGLHIASTGAALGYLGDTAARRSESPSRPGQGDEVATGPYGRASQRLMSR